MATQGRGPDESARFIATFLSLMLIALIPLANVIRLASPRGWEAPDRAKAWQVSATVIALILLIAAPLLLWVPIRLHFDVPQLLGTVVLVAAFALQLSFVFGWTYQAVSRATVVAAVWVALTWIGPILADLCVYLASESDSDFEMGTISDFGPIGALVSMWEDRAVPTTGLAVQVLLILIPLLLWLPGFRKSRGGLNVSAVLTPSAGEG